MNIDSHKKYLEIKKELLNITEKLVWGKTGTKRTEKKRSTKILQERKKKKTEQREKEE